MENTHSSALIAKHAGLDARITAERNRPAPDGTLIATLKKQKLKIKEALGQV
ncbi:MAG: YdcH family protein [Sphingomonadaceae bacterium]